MGNQTVADFLEARAELPSYWLSTPSLLSNMADSFDVLSVGLNLICHKRAHSQVFMLFSTTMDYAHQLFDQITEPDIFMWRSALFNGGNLRKMQRGVAEKKKVLTFDPPAAATAATTAAATVAATVFRYNPAELHVRLHLTKADRTVFVDKRSKDKNDRFQAELAAATQSQAAGEGSSSTPEPIDENELFLSLEAIKKQRVYGIGSASASYIGQSSRLRRGGSSQSQQQAVVSEEIEQRIAREVEERLEQRMRTVEAGFEERVEQRIRTVEAGFDERIRTELARLMTTLPPELRPQFPPPPPPPADDTTSLE
ncbi:uncharacterized protein LOC126668504 [Mercurialis annua]|uniref:uncharacterized protein LOC126668504 n=1 Tax=Mercurialis annua TaxID=3986 RepID=UPI0024ADD0C2|nr:uncharacterized protein LOC126668504 [Mercurialis annua]